VLCAAVVAAVTLAIAGAAPALAEVSGQVTSASDNLRTGWYPEQPTITPGALTGNTFHEDFKAKLQGQIYAQPLIADRTLLVVTEADKVYGLDPETGAVKWEKPIGIPVSSEDPEIKCPDLSPEIGITGTPVIDTTDNIAYFVANRYAKGNSDPVWEMHAIELDNNERKEAPGFPKPIEGEAENLAGVKFKAAEELQRPALLLMNGVAYAAFGSHCDKTPFQGWIVGISTSGVVKTKWATAREGGSIWQSGGGLISDGEGQILFATGNGEEPNAEADPPPGTEKPTEGRLGEAVVRVEVQSGGSLEAEDLFSPFDDEFLDEKDYDLGSSAPIALPPQLGTKAFPDLLVQGGKEGSVYLLNRDELGGTAQGLGGKDKTLRTLEKIGGVWDGAAVWPGDGGYVYLPTVSPPSSDGAGSVGHLFSFKYEVGGGEKPTLSVASKSPEEFGFGSGSPIVTSDGTNGGSAILWITRCEYGTKELCENAELRAYNPVPVGTELQQLWSAPIGTGNKFSRPYANNGHIYIANHEGDVFAYSAPAPPPPTSSGSGSTANASFTAPPPAPAPVVIPGAPLPALAHLKLPSALSASASRRHKTRLTFTLSSAGTVYITIYRSTISHHCARGAHSCTVYVATKLKFKLAGHVGSNTVTLNLSALTAGSYRLYATPIAKSGVRGVKRELAFKVA
jgi:outer membrane protein assembly factor BamB